ncbi:hypothetical protein C1H46_017815 [Malus baccata]|uniref:Uncharacterized protein n=1 Tax=Malus baccata TaxID=106549 RepID=A0A540MCZ3_MALBA|nr:hypothetical protein C1H46_017815 [Malus baccata]
MSFAFVILNELVEELRVKPCPVVFVAHSAGTKALYVQGFSGKFCELWIPDFVFGTDKLISGIAEILAGIF